MLKSPKKLLSVKEFVRWGCDEFNKHDLFYGHGTDNAWDEALVLVIFAVDLSYDEIDEHADDEVIPSQREKIVALFEQRITQRIPAAYITKSAWFADLPFYVDERVLIPRSPFAELIQNKFKPWVNENNVKRILDLGTGNGCIAIACAMNFPNTSVDAVDVSKDALEVASINVEKHKVSNRVQFYHGDLFQPLLNHKYDLIVANPPYVSNEEYLDLPLEYQHEPKNGLLAEDEGLIIVERILKQAKDYLSSGGVLIVEVGNSEPLLVERYPNVPFLWLEFAHGGQGVFLLTAQQLTEHF